MGCYPKQQWQRQGTRINETRPPLLTKISNLTDLAIQEESIQQIILLTPRSRPTTSGTSPSCHHQQAVHHPPS